MPYTYPEDMTTSDVAFCATGPSLEELFGTAADATLNVMMEVLAALEERERVGILVRSNSLDMLLFKFLGELIYLKDAKGLLLRVRDVIVEEREGSFSARAIGWGEKLDPTRHCLVVDVKAVTLHNLSVTGGPEGWKATVVLDV
jgi:SHS2 domain-containing protein